MSLFSIKNKIPYLVVKGFTCLTGHLSVFCIIASRKAIFLDSMTQVGINTVISA